MVRKKGANKALEAIIAGSRAIPNRISPSNRHGVYNPVPDRRTKTQAKEVLLASRQSENYGVSEVPSFILPIPRRSNGRRKYKRHDPQNPIRLPRCDRRFAVHPVDLQPRLSRLVLEAVQLPAQVHPLPTRLS